MPCCGNDLPPKIEDGRHIRTEGSGTPQDPLIISATTALDVEDNAIFNLILDGDGTLESPWRLQLAWASSAQLTDMPDVFAEDPADGTVLTYNKDAGRWEAGPPAQATPGTIHGGNGITGDGSAGAPLRVKENAARYIVVDAAGVGLSDDGLASLIRPYANAAERTAAGSPTTETAFSVLESRPDVIDRWDGSAWVPVTGGRSLDIQSDELLALSGSYGGGSITTYIAQLAFTTDDSGAFEVIPSLDLTDYSGVLSCEVQETGDIAWHCQVKAGTNNIVGVAHRLDTGLIYPAATLTGTVRATLY